MIDAIVLCRVQGNDTTASPLCLKLHRRVGADVVIIIRKVLVESLTVYFFLGHNESLTVIERMTQ